MKVKVLIAIFVLFLIFIFTVSCVEEQPLAPEGTTVYIKADPTTIYSTNDYSKIIVTAYEPNGLPIRDNVSVYFSSDIGIITDEAKTKDGYVVVNFYSDGRTGTATITARMPKAEPVSVQVEIVEREE